MAVYVNDQAINNPAYQAIINVVTERGGKVTYELCRLDNTDENVLLTDEDGHIILADLDVQVNISCKLNDFIAALNTTPEDQPEYNVV